MNKEEFIFECKKLGIIITEENIKKLDTYRKLLEEWNKSINLTSITEEEEVYLKHFYDSICLVKAVDLNEILTLCDLGTGAGFPGIVLKILFSDLKVTLLEPIIKKCKFLIEVIDKLNLKNVIVVNDRAENYAKNKREFYDIVTCRAVSHLKIISELSIPMLKVNGYFIPLKGIISEEINESDKILQKLNSKIETIIEYNLPVENAKRTIIKIKKNGKTSLEFPRNYSIIKKEIKNKK